MKFTYLKQPPKKYTFEMPKLKKWIEKRCRGRVLNLFAGKVRLSVDEVRVDIDPTFNPDYCMDAFEFVMNWKEQRFDTIVLDPPYCYSHDTEILTENGWKLLKDIVENKEKIKVATLNKETEELEYHYPISYYKYRYNGKMIKIESNSINLLITPNHNLYVRKNWKTNQFQFYKANKIDFGINFKKNCNWKGINKENFILPSVNLIRANKYGEIFKKDKKICMEDWLRFFGIWLSDGCVKNRVRKKRKMASDYSVYITQKKQPNRDIIEGWINKIGYKYSKDNYDFIIYDKQLYTYLKQFGKSHDKYIPKELKNLPPKQLECLIEGLMLGDGCINIDKNGYVNKSYSTASKKLSDDFAEIILKTGKATSIRKYKRVYVLRIIESRLTPKIRKNLINKYFHRIDYDGFVYCLEVPNNIVYVRRNIKKTKQSCWCGNSTRKAMEKYKGNWIGNFAKIKKELPRVMNSQCRLIEFGYSTSGFGKGYIKKEVCLICHGGAHHDTIILVSEKMGGIKEFL